MTKETPIRKGIVYLFAAFSILLLMACQTATSTDTQEELPPEAVLEAQSWLAEQLNVAVEDVEIVATEQMEWTDSCLGLGGAAEICATVITPGWQANFDVNGQQYEVRLDETGTTIRSPQVATEPPSLENE